ncbi:MAG: STAS domain-containing protein [Pseudomonadota bacterium]
MELSIENAGPYVSVRLYGHLDSRGSGDIYDAVVGLGALGPGHVVLDLEAVTGATRAGCGVIFVAAKMLLVRSGRKLHIYNASPEVADILTKAGFDHLIDVRPRAIGFPAVHRAA